METRTARLFLKGGGGGNEKRPHRNRLSEDTGQDQQALASRTLGGCKEASCLASDGQLLQAGLAVGLTRSNHRQLQRNNPCGSDCPATAL